MIVRFFSGSIKLLSSFQVKENSSALEIHTTLKSDGINNMDHFAFRYENLIRNPLPVVWLHIQAVETMD